MTPIKLTPEECLKQFMALPLEAQQWLMKIALELNRAIEKHPRWPSDMIHRVAIIGEESGELIRAAVQYQYENGERGELAKEAIQTGAMCLRLLLTLKDEE